MPCLRPIQHRGRCRTALGNGLWALAWLAFPAWAIDITVDILGDPVPDGCTPGHCSLREAITLANSLPGPDRIFLPSTPGVPLQLTIQGANEDANATGDLDILDDLEIIGTGAATTLLLQTVQDRVMQATMANDKRLVLRGLTIQGGRSTQGGALQATSLVTIEDVAFVGNTVNSSSGMPQGGAIYFFASYSPSITEPRLVLRRVRFENNRATTQQGEALGGALHAWSFFSGAPFTLIEDCDFIGNESTMGGGAVYFSGSPNNFGGDVVIRRSRFSDNRTGGSGGAAIHTGLISSFVLRIEDSLFDANVATGASSGMAGAIHLGQVTSAMLLRTTLASNRGNLGGALLSAARRTNLVDSHLFDNTATRGGGALWAASDLTVANSTFESNRVTSNDAADPGGGAIWASGNSHVIMRSTFSGNDAFRGGAISMKAGQMMQLQRSTIIASAFGIGGRQGTAIHLFDENQGNVMVIANNILSGSCLFASSGFRWGQAHNNIEAPGNSCRLTTGIINAQNQVSATSAQINLGPLTDNGGPTPTRLPGTGSIAINQGSETFCSTTDQRHYARTDALCDIGAVEVGAIADVLFRSGFEQGNL